MCWGGEFVVKICDILLSFTTNIWKCLMHVSYLVLMGSSAKVVVELSKQELVQAAVLLHPSFVTVDDIKGK